MPRVTLSKQSPLDYRVERSKRKTIELRLLDANTLLVKTPLYTTQERIDELLHEKAAWIAKIRQLKTEILPIPKMEEGECLLYLGSWHTLQILNTNIKSPDTKTPGIIKISPTLAARGTATLVQLYRETIRELSQHYVDLYAKRWNLHYKSIKITGAKTRWGSCGRDGRLCFSWRLAMTPLLSIENVVAHELAHTVYHNHQADFWKLLKQMMPRYAEGQAWLDQNAHKLPKL